MSVSENQLSEFERGSPKYFVSFTCLIWGKRKYEADFWAGFSLGNNDGDEIEADLLFLAEISVELEVMASIDRGAIE